MTSDLEKFEHGDWIEVPVGKIEQQLDALWRQAAAHAKDQRHAVTRASLWNLVVLARGEDEFVRSKQLVDGVSQFVPARAIVLRVEDPDAPGEGQLRAYVEANWRRESGSDEVTLIATGRAIDRLPALVRSLALTDLPRAIFYAGQPQPRNENIVDEVDRLIADTRKLADERGLVEWHRLGARHARVELADLAWLGTTPLRKVLASLFDPPRDPAPLRAIDRVVVASGVRGVQSRALLVLGWLAARLGWRDLEKLPPQGAARRWLAARDGGEVELRLETRAGSDHGVSAVELTAGDDTWSVERERCLEVRGPGLPPQTQPARSHADGELLAAALGPRGRDPIYRDALAQAAALVDAT